VKALRKEAGELLAIFIASRQTARERLKKNPSNRNGFEYSTPD
jgi:hypothetical protein